MPGYPGQTVYPGHQPQIWGIPWNPEPEPPPPPTPTPPGPAPVGYTCRYCGKHFSSEAGIRLHMPQCPKNPINIVEPEEGVFPCPYCGEEFGTAGALTMHKAQCPLNPANEPEEEPEAGINTCEYCGQEFPTVDALATHIVVCPQNPANIPYEEPEMVNPWPVGSPEYMEEEFGRWPGFGTAMGLFGREYLSPHEKYQAGLQPQLESLYDIGGRMGTAGQFGQYAPGGMFSQWAPGYAQNPRGMYGLAGQMMGSVAGMTPEERAGAGMGYEGGDLASLLQMALRTQLGKQTAGWLTGQLPSARQSWMAQYPQQQGPSFMDYIMQKYNLGQYF